MTGYDLDESYSDRFHAAEAARLAALHRADVAEATLARVRAAMAYLRAEADHYATLTAAYGGREYSGRWSAYDDAAAHVAAMLGDAIGGDQ